MPKSLTVMVEPKVLRGLRERLGWNMEEASKKLDTTINIMRDLESGQRYPTMKQLRDLSLAYKHPLASFFLSELKAQKPLPNDYRTLPNKKDMFDKTTIWAIRRSQRLQDIGLNLSQNIKSDIKLKVDHASLDDDPSDISALYRKSFDLSFEKQKKFKDTYKLFSYMRSKLEDMNLLVFQFSMPVEDARGFTLADESPYVIVISSKDTIEARLFTLMHEFGHILLGETAIGTPGTLRLAGNVEKWCDLFASSFLLPDNTAKELFRDNHSQLAETKTLNMLSRKCKVSRAVLIRKMLDLDYISKPQFKSILDRYATISQDVSKTKANYAVPPDKKCISQVGNRFVSLVASNLDKSLITYTDALSYLSTKSGTIEKIMAEAEK